MAKNNLIDASEIMILRTVSVTSSMDEWLRQKAEKWDCSKNEVIQRMLMRCFRKDKRSSAKKQRRSSNE
jgi:hypothetical protein